MKQSTVVANGVVVLGILGLFAGMQLWAEHQRHREWWWISGDASGMLFLDLSDSENSKGHLLSTDGLTGDEFSVAWNCKSKAVRWGAMWTRDRNFNQMQRRPAPSDLKNWHAAKSNSERRLVEVACAPPEDRITLRSVRTDRQPIKATQEALELVRNGHQPDQALFQALGVD